MAAEEENHNVYSKCDFPNKKHAFLSWFSDLDEKCPNDSLLFIIRNRSAFLSLLRENNTTDNIMSSAMITLGKACNADNHHRKTLNKLMINLSSSMDNIVINLQRHLISLSKLQILEKHQLDALLYLTEFLKNFQLTLPSSSMDSICMLLPSLESTCDKILKNHKELNSVIKENIKLIKEEQKQFFENISFQDKNKLSENEKLQLEEPPENFRSLSILPTVDDVDMPCSFLRPNLVKGKYRDAEHYLDVQFRLLKEDYIKPLRDGVAEYRSLKKDDKSLRNCKHVRVYCKVFVYSEEFVEGDLLHVIKFQDKFFSTIKWENSKRLLTGNLLCLSTDDFRTMLFATVIKRDPKELTRGLLLVKFVEIDERTLNLDYSINYTVIEVPTLFESYRHNLKVLHQLDEDSLPMKNYIVNVEKEVSKPEYLQLTTVFDMRPLLYPLEMGFLISAKINWKRDTESFLKQYKVKEYITSKLNFKKYQYVLLEDSTLKSDVYKKVHLTDENEWPPASKLSLDESQYSALKSAITKEFSIIQGPPGTGKTYIGLRIVQLLLHNLNVWFHDNRESLPMLIVCYTNHALDQFLEGILHLTERIVRIGGRSSNEAIEKFQIKNLVRCAKQERRMPSFIKHTTSEARDEIEKIKKRIQSAESSLYSQSNNKVLHEDTLRRCIPHVQFASLKRTNCSVANKNLKTKNNLYEWLEIDTFEDCQMSMHQGKREPLICSNNMQGREFENEEEADIEFTENQRNIDYYDFSDRIVLRNNSKSDRNDDISHEQGWQDPNKKQKQAEYIRNSLQNNPVMNEKRALRIKNIWNLPINERWQLYKFWLECFHEAENQTYLNLQRRLKAASEELSNARTLEDLWVLKHAQVVGMTTTGAAKYRHIIEARNPVILIVEEAAEILESHIITSLTSKTKHVILIGDQQQLQPSPTVYALAEKYGMNVSLFERMIMNGMEYRRLSLQHRMRPEIAALIVPHIYTDLDNHEVVTKFENIKGVGKNVFFVAHTFDELHVEDSKSKVNEHEARFIIRLCKYLIHQGYEPSQITILTSYSGQLFALKKLAVDEDVRKVRISVVDNFQGEENDIILISFVRSNTEGDIGFLKVSNRVCVALSRAKKGLFCIGNFGLLAAKSKLWKDILQTLATNKSIGSSLRLICQNHPDVRTDVANYSDFNAVPEGGCTRKCEYRLLCGHSCTLLCHPYDPDHEEFKCKKPCVRSCEMGHPCQKKCFIDCEPCPVIVEKVLSRCGHKVTTYCGKDESEIECTEPCKRICKVGHPCPKKCFEECGYCKVEVEKVLSRCGHKVTTFCGKDESEIECSEPCKKICKVGHACPKKCFEECGYCKVKVEKVLSRCGHKVTTFCGKDESEIKCREPCKEICKEGHPCPKECFQKCGDCEVIVDKILSKCKHTVKAACHIPERKIKCENQCIKTCERSHLCQKKCFEVCGRCDVVMEKTLNCGHTMMVPCGKKEYEIKCLSECKKILHCTHRCKNKCYEVCERRCLQLLESRSPVCGHSFKVECCFAQDSAELAKRCPEPCQKILLCGHICKGSCSTCKQGNEHIICNETCRKLLLCDHLCLNKCAEACVVNCKKIMKISSQVCGHLLNIECYLSDNLNELSRRCLKACREILPCGHTCRGSCGSCYQGRLHVSCNEICNKTLICGHKCESKCCFSCPPCKKPCESRCVHKRCPKRCGEPCVKCVKPCNWSCSHKKCTRRCSEVCDRDPCNVKCSKKLPCSHPCFGFCGEPCPKECFLCSENTPKENSSTITNEKSAGYVYLEDCKHTLKEDDLRKWLSSKSSRLHEIKLKDCPQCGTIIRMNSRFNKIVKKCVSDVEEIKEVSKYNRDNLDLQRNLLQQINKSHSNINHLYISVIKVLSGGRVRDIYELTNLESIMNLSKEIELEKYGLYSMFALTPFMEKLVVYMRSCREWMIDFIGKNFLSVSEYQLQQLSVEVYRLSLLSFLLSIAEQSHFASLSTEFEKSALSLINFKALSDDNVEYFIRHIKNFVVNLKDVPVKYSFPQKIVNMSAPWYQCSKGHIICLPNMLETYDRKECYKCRKTTDNKKLLNSSSKTKDVENYSETLDYFDVEEALDENNIPILNDTTESRGRFFKKDERTNFKMGSVDKKTNISADYNSRFHRKFNPHSEFAKWPHKSNVPETLPRFNKDNVFRKSSEKNSDEKFFNSTRTFNKPISRDNVFQKNTKKSSNETFYNPTHTTTFRKPTSDDNVPREIAEKRDDKNIPKSLYPYMKQNSKSNVFGRNSEKSNNEKFSNATHAKAFMKPISKYNVSQKNTEKKDDEMFSKRPYDPFIPTYPISGHTKKTFVKPASKDNVSQKNTEKRDDERFSKRPFMPTYPTRAHPKKTFMKPLSKDNVSQKNTEKKDDERFSKRP